MAMSRFAKISRSPSKACKMVCLGVILLTVATLSSEPCTAITSPSSNARSSIIVSEAIASLVTSCADRASATPPTPRPVSVALMLKPAFSSAAMPTSTQ